MPLSSKPMLKSSFIACFGRYIFKFNNIVRHLRPEILFHQTKLQVILSVPAHLRKTEVPAPERPGTGTEMVFVKYQISSGSMAAAPEIFIA